LITIGDTTWPSWWAYLRQFDTYALLLVVAAACTLLFTPVYIRIAQRLNWVDRPRGRHQHARATPTMGGIVVFLPVFAGALIALATDNLVGEKLREGRMHVLALLGCTAITMLLGVIDDRRAVRPRVKLLVQFLIAVAAVVLGFRVEAITLPWLESLVIPSYVGIALSILWIVGITNAINLTDGLDGLAAGVCLLAAGINTLVAIWLGNHTMAVMMVLLTGALLGFLRYNFHPARVFLGDTGALALGVFLALASLRSAQKAHTAVMILVPLFALGYPIIDTMLAIARRSMKGQPLFSSDRDHIHHRLLERGHKPSAAAIRIYFLSLLLCLLCIAAAAANHLILGVGMALVLGLTVFAARVLGYLEWGGWTVERRETRILHAAAQLSRLKLRAAKDDEERVQALGVTATELGCGKVELARDKQATAWWLPSYDEAVNGTVHTAIDQDGLAVRFHLPTSMASNDPRLQLLDDLAAEIARAS